MRRDVVAPNGLAWFPEEFPRSFSRHSREGGNDGWEGANDTRDRYPGTTFPGITQGHLDLTQTATIPNRTPSG